MFSPNGDWKFHQEQSFDDILEFPDVSRPIVLQQDVKEFLREFRHSSRGLIRELTAEFLHQQWNVLFALSQRGQVHVRNIKTKKEILTKRLLCRHGIEVLVRRRNK